MLITLFDPLSERRAAGLQVWGPDLVKALPCWRAGGAWGCVSEKGWSVSWGGRKGSKVERLGEVPRGQRKFWEDRGGAREGDI